MPRILINPNSLMVPRGNAYSHVSIGVGQTHITFAGQVPINFEGEVVGEGDLHAQVVQCMNNLKAAMDAVNVGWDDVVRRIVYTTKPGEAALISAAIFEATGGAANPPQTLLGVTGLARDSFLVEIEASAVI